MCIVILFIWALFITSCLCGNLEDTNLTLKVVGGFDCHPKLLPYLASVQTDRHTVFCGGSLINPSWTLTAAHCCSRKYHNYTVWTGLTDLRRQFVQWSSVKRMIPHENFTVYPWSNDICLLELDKPIKENRYTKYVRLISPSYYETLMVNTRCNRSLALGFGYRSTVYMNNSAEPNYHDTVLQCVFQRVMQDQYCKVANISVDTTTMLCVHGNPKETSDTCRGDSGGPLICQGYQIGIVAAGLGCGLGYRSYFTKTAVFQDFIQTYVSVNVTKSYSTSDFHKLHIMSFLLPYYFMFMSIID